MDNLAIISQRIVENSKVNPRKYGLVKQIGPYDITPADMFNYHENPRKIRRLQAIQPDAVPNGVQDDLVYLPTLLGGGFSMEKGSVVQEAIYDARITAPGQKVRGMPLEGPGVLRAINSQVIAPNTYPVPSAMVSSAPLETTPQGYPEPMRTESDQVIVPNAGGVVRCHGRPGQRPGQRRRVRAQAACDCAQRPARQGRGRQAGQPRQYAGGRPGHHPAAQGNHSEQQGPQPVGAADHFRHRQKTCRRSRSVHWQDHSRSQRRAGKARLGAHHSACHGTAAQHRADDPPPGRHGAGVTSGGEPQGQP